MEKIVYIILVSFVCLLINSCAEIDRSSESENYSLTKQNWSSGYDIFTGTTFMSAENLFAPEHPLTYKSVNVTPNNNNIFLVKQNKSGTKEWIIDLEISDDESEISMTFDSFDNVYITGYKRNLLDGKKNLGGFTVFLTKYNPSGSIEWVKHLGKSAIEYGARLIVDSSEKIYVTGFSSEFESENEFSSQNNLLAKYDSSGTREWAKTLGSTLTNFAWDLTVDSMDNIYVKGFSGNSFLQKNSEHDDFLLMKFNKDGIKF